MSWVEQRGWQRRGWSRGWERYSLPLGGEENRQGYPEDARACFGDKSCGKK